MLDINVIAKDSITKPQQLEVALELAQSQSGIRKRLMGISIYDLIHRSVSPNYYRI
jgi:hypothetical protein